jgi:hypothetical protein
MLPTSLNKLDKDFTQNYVIDRKLSVDSFETDDSHDNSVFEMEILDTCATLKTNKRFTYKYGLLDCLKIIPQTMKHIEYTSYNYIYHINTNGLLPFLQFYFPRNKFVDFPLCERKGVLVDDSCIYIFYEIEDKNLEYIKHDWIAYTVDEIINKNKANNEIKQFMLRHQEVLFLSDENGVVIETPIVSYQTISKNNKYVSDAFSIMGPYYYFNVEHGSNMNRFALFLGKVYVPMNFPKDTWDKSLLKSQQLREHDDKNKYYRHINRISDHDGNWTYHYDSVYLGKLELDNGESLREHSQWVVKTVEQFVLLDE